MISSKPLGPLMIDVAGLSLTDEDREVLSHSLVGGVIFFTKNFKDKEQLRALVKEIRACREDLLLAVDHEGGRVQRFKEGFTLLPPMGDLGKLYQHDPEKSLKLVKAYASIMARELQSVGIDFSFAPVLDLDKGLNEVIGDRAFHRNKDIVFTLGLSFMQTVQAAGMNAVGKHFPGHGHVALDSHVAMPVDHRSISEIIKDDLWPFQKLIEAGISAIMPAHIVFPGIDDKPVCFSRLWLQDILRLELGFKGMIISDDLFMEGASVVGSIEDRVSLALEAGCDMVILSHRRKEVLSILGLLSIQGGVFKGGG